MEKGRNDNGHLGISRLMVTKAQHGVGGFQFNNDGTKLRGLNNGPVKNVHRQEGIEGIAKLRNRNIHIGLQPKSLDS